MPTWLKYLLSVVSGFATGAAAAQTGSPTTKGTLIGGALGAAVAVGNLQATAPKDEPKSK